MDYRVLGSTGLEVSQIGFGCGNVGGLMIRGEPEERVRAVARAMELGVNYFDTAPSYGNGVSERNLGQALKALSAEVYVGTKLRLEPQDMADARGALIRSVEESLTRLDRDYVDLIQVHNRIATQRDTGRDSLAAEDLLGVVVDTFRSLKAQGKVRNYGITGLGDTEALQRVIDSGELDTVQVCYNLINPSAGQPVPPGFDLQDFGRLIERAEAANTGVIVIRVLAAGALSGEEARHPVAVPSVAPIGSGQDYREDMDRATRFGFLVDEGHVEGMVEAAIRFALGKNGVSTVLVGYSSLEHLEKAVAYAARGPLPEDVLGRLPEVWGRIVPG
jgi:aryl-alcohol dehydrogenase-like predicted oxidoreductase